jgi:hypothetical protein
VQPETLLPEKNGPGARVRYAEKPSPVGVRHGARCPPQDCAWLNADATADRIHDPPADVDPRRLGRALEP